MTDSKRSDVSVALCALKPTRTSGFVRRFRCGWLTVLSCRSYAQTDRLFAVTLNLFSRTIRSGLALSACLGFLDLASKIPPMPPEALPFCPGQSHRILGTTSFHLSSLLRAKVVSFCSAVVESDVAGALYHRSFSTILACTGSR